MEYVNPIIEQSIERPIENQKTEEGITDIDIISELREAIKMCKTKKPELVAGMIDEVLIKDYSGTEKDARFSNAINEIKEYISNMRYTCNLKYTQRILIVESVLRKLDGDV